jgi:CRP/FNR family transcriptional regulator
MHATLTHYLQQNSTLPDNAIQAITAMAVPKTLRRNEPLLEAGTVCRHKAFIAQGLLRTGIIGSSGNEHILQFSPELSWTLDPESYDKKIPSAVTIAAIEPAQVLLWDKKDFDYLLAEFPLLKKFSEQLISRTGYHIRQRMATALSATPEEKYEEFVRNFPRLLQRLPLRMVASYLGISLKTLTRIRQAQLQR